MRHWLPLWFLVGSCSILFLIDRWWDRFFAIFFGPELGLLCGCWLPTFAVVCLGLYLSVKSQPPKTSTALAEKPDLTEDSKSPSSNLSIENTNRPLRPWFYLFLTIFFCLSLLTIDIWPGVFGAIFIDSLFAQMTCVCYTPMALFLYFVYLVTRDSPRKEVPQRDCYRFIITRWLLVSITFLLWFWDVPRRIAFSFYRHEFEALIANAPREEELVELNQQIGPFFVDRYGVYPYTGDGIHFRTKIHREKFVNDAWYGFAYLPNYKGLNSSSSGCYYGHLQGNWYWFRLIDDF